MRISFTVFHLNAQRRTQRPFRGIRKPFIFNAFDDNSTMAYHCQCYWGIGNSNSVLLQSNNTDPARWCPTHKFGMCIVCWSYVCVCMCMCVCFPLKKKTKKREMNDFAENIAIVNPFGVIHVRQCQTPWCTFLHHPIEITTKHSSGNDSPISLEFHPTQSGVWVFWWALIIRTFDVVLDFNRTPSWLFSLELMSDNKSYLVDFNEVGF